MQKGIGLLEILLVLVVTSTLLLTVMHYAQENQKIRTLAHLQRRVQTLMDALNNYYYIACARNNLVLNTNIIDQLETLGLWSNRLGDTENNAPYLSAEIILDARNYYSLKISAIIDNSALASEIRSKLNADPVGLDNSVNTVSWTKFPAANADHLNAKKWIVGHDLYLSVMNDFTGTGLWVLNNNLQRFVKQNFMNNNDHLCKA